MHKFLRSIGFSQLQDRKELQKILYDIIHTAKNRSYVSTSEHSVLAEFSRDFGENIGIAVVGEFDEDNQFQFDHFYPYLRGNVISSQEDVSIEKHFDNEAYAGVCDDVKMGVTLIFYLQDTIPYIKAMEKGVLPIKGTTLTLAGLADSGTIMMPILKNSEEIEKNKKAANDRYHLLAEARQGNEEAIETLTLEDMDLYTNLSKKIQKEDVFSLVDTYFMPYGVESDQYSVLGEILGCHLIANDVTGEHIYLMTIECNEMEMDICINQKDLLGEPLAGRRFKGNVWLQGAINYPDAFVNGSDSQI